MSGRTAVIKVKNEKGKQTVGRCYAGVWVSRVRAEVQSGENPTQTEKERWCGEANDHREVVGRTGTWETTR